MAQKLKYQIFIDPYYGSERYVDFYPSWVVEVEDRYQKLFLRPREPVTYIRFRNGEKHLVFGHHTAEIKAAQAEDGTAASDADTEAEVDIETQTNTEADANTKADTGNE